jgi:YHS domain-containing protein
LSYIRQLLQFIHFIFVANSKPMKLLLLAFLFLNNTFLFAQNADALRIKHFNTNAAGLALEGYDAVSYFSGKPTKGVSTLAYKYNSITYYFATQKNLQLFKASPTLYEPTYGGWCAYAMGARVIKQEVDVTTYKIIDGRLNLYFNKYFNNTLNKWNKDEKVLNANAKANWIKIYK